MAYEKQTWQTGETITAEKLNHMEEGIGSCVMVVNATTEGGNITLDKTWQEIHDAVVIGKVVTVVEIDKNPDRAKTLIVTTCNGDADERDYFCQVFWETGEGTSSLTYTTETPNGYPRRPSIG